MGGLRTWLDHTRIRPTEFKLARRRGSVSKSASRPSTTRWRSGILSGFAPTRFTAVESGFRLHRSLRSHRPWSKRGADALAGKTMSSIRAHICAAQADAVRSALPFWHISERLLHMLSSDRYMLGFDRQILIFLGKHIHLLAQFRATQSFPQSPDFLGTVALIVRGLHNPRNA